MHDDFLSLYAYSRWADRHLIEACRQLSPEQFVAAPAPGWSSVRSTMAHLAIVTEGWMRGIAGETVEQVPTEADFQTIDDVEAHLNRAYAIAEKLLPSFDPGRLAEPMTFRSRGRSAVLPPWVVLRHLVNHATYHRGQVASKLKMLGVQPPATDLVFWAFEQFPQI